MTVHVTHLRIKFTKASRPLAENGIAGVDPVQSSCRGPVTPVTSTISTDAPGLVSEMLYID